MPKIIKFEKNQKIGDIIVKIQVKKPNKKGIYWKFYCKSCKQFSITHGSIIKLYGDKACYCKKIYNKYIIGKKYGYLLVLEKTKSIKHIFKKSKGYATWYKCRCDCGNIKEIKKGHLINGAITSCGCKNIRKRELNGRWKGYGHIRGNFIATLKKSANARNIKFDENLNEKYLWNLFLKQKRKCKLSGIELCFGTSNKNERTTASLDRINPNLGYTKGNLQWIFRDINFMKWRLQNDEFIKLCILIAKQHPHLHEENFDIHNDITIKNFKKSNKDRIK